MYQAVLWRACSRVGAAVGVTFGLDETVQNGLLGTINHCYMGRTSDARERLIEAMGELIWTGSYGSTTIDQICARADASKGSFYHFFPSKSQLAEAALTEAWAKFRGELDHLFSPSIPPLERIRRYCEFELQYQQQMCRKYGVVLGCPYCTLGTEISTLEGSLRRKLDDFMSKQQRYFESAIRDAHAEKLVHAPDPGAKAAIVYAYVEGVLSLARIRNSLEGVKELEKGIFTILDARLPAAA
jgi:TetR/AcrR family transcriptional regulator, transcriptional repressor for nem operon